jgi:hypothetical protein
MLHAAALAIAMASARSVKCTWPAENLPFFAAVTPAYDAAVESGPLTVQIRVKAPRIAQPWKLVSDVTLVSSTGESLTSRAPQIQNDDSGEVATFFFAAVNRSRTYHVQVHWREPALPGCPAVPWTSLLGQFSTL